MGAILDMSLGNLNHKLETEPDSIFDEALSEFRRASTVNTWMVLSPALDPGDQPFLLWPDLDVLRTLA
jgi:hypothetical protein